MAAQKNISLRSYMENMDESKKQILRELREKMKDELEPEDDDFLLLRFLKARNFDIVKAEKMLRDSLKSQKKLNVELKDYQVPEVLQKHNCIVTFGNDRDGDPVTYLCLRGIDFKGLAYCFCLTDQIKFCMNTINKHLGVSKKPKNEIVGSFILDLEDISLAFATSALVLRIHFHILTYYQANYPETLKTCYAINAPAVCNILLNIYKKAIDANVIQKIRIFGKDDYQETLREIMDPDLLPACFGGNRTDPDGNPGCTTLICRDYLKVPTSYYLTANDDTESEPGTKNICVRERASYDYRVKINAPNSILKWYFRSETYNIKFGMYYVNDDVPQTPKLNRKYEKASNKTLKKVGYETIFPLEFAESHIIAERGEYVCKRIGTYVFRFDNTFSWMTPKEITFKAEVLAPTESKPVQTNGHHK